MEKTFAGKVALVTGGGSGIGKAVALELAVHGASVVVNDLHLEEAMKVVDQIVSSGGNAVSISGDVGKAEDVKAIVDLAVTTYGGLHLAFNNAGIGGPMGAIADIDLQGYRDLMHVNLDSVFYGMHFEIPAMIKSGGGAIVNTSSILGLVADGGALPYVAAKHGITGMTKAAAISYADKKIRINSVHPGYIDTPLLGTLPKEALAGIIALHPMGRLGTAHEVADLVLFLLSEKSTFITGSAHLVDGGYTAR